MLKKESPPPVINLTSDYVPVGELILKAGEWSREKEWRDVKTKLEMLLVPSVASLELYAEEELETRERSRIWHMEYEMRLKLEEVEKQRKT